MWLSKKSYWQPSTIYCSIKSKTMTVFSVVILRGGLGGTWPPRFLLGPLLGHPSFFLNFPFKFIWSIYKVDYFRPAIF